MKMRQERNLLFFYKPVKLTDKSFYQTKHEKGPV